MIPFGIFRRPSRLERLLADFNREVDETRAQQQRQEEPPREPMPPRPQLRRPLPLPDTAPRWGNGPDLDFDPCGNDPVAGPKTISDGTETAP